MSSFGKCCCAEADCLCDEAWDIANVSFSVFGATISGALSPSTKPIPFTLENSCNVRVFVGCVYDTPSLVVDTLVNVSWSTDELPALGTVCQCSGCSYLPGQIATLWSLSGASSLRVAVWHHVQRYATVTAIECDNGKVKFIVNVIYSVTRMTKSMQRFAVRYKEHEIDCSTSTTTPVGDYVYDYWDDSNYVIDDVPSLPCAWPQLNTAGACEDQENITDPECDRRDPGVSSLDITQLICEGGVCVENATTREYSNAYGPIDFGCGCIDDICSFGLPLWNSVLRADRKEYNIVWESDCVDCSEIGTLPDTITVNRVSASISIPSTGDVTAFPFSTVSGGFCGTIPFVSVVIPYSITLSLS